MKGSRHDHRSRYMPPSSVVRPLLPGCTASCVFPVAQRSSVILMDVLGYSLRGDQRHVLDTSMPCGQGRHCIVVASGYSELADEPDDRPPPDAEPRPTASGSPPTSTRFNARDFDAVRDMLAQEVRLELVARTRLNGRKEVATYFGNYSRVQDWHLAPGFVENRPAILVRDPNDPTARPTYFILLSWQDGRLAAIRDFRHARYVADGAELSSL